MKKLIVLISTMALLLSSSFTVFAEELPHGNVGGGTGGTAIGSGCSQWNGTNY